MKKPIKTAMKIIAVNLLIGNVVAWNMGAAPIDFPAVAYSEQEQKLVSELKTAANDSPEDADVQTQLGALYSLHNELDDAANLLSLALDNQADDPVAQAWLGATRAKQSGAMFDPFMGLFKLYKLHSACAALDQAVAQAPDNFEIRMIRLATFAPTNVLNCSVETALQDGQWFEQFFAKQGKNAPLELKMQFNLAMSKAYANLDDQQQATLYINAFKQLAQGQTLTPSVKHELAEANKLIDAIASTINTKKAGEHS